MTAAELFQDGQLSKAIEAQLAVVKANPSDQAARVFLFELAAFAGDLGRARKQIEALPLDNQEQVDTAAFYRRLLDSEEARRRLFTHGQAPMMLGDPPEHLTKRLDAVLLLIEKRPTEAAELLDTANREAPPIRGSLNGRPFELLRDTDDLFASVLEVLANGMYYWIALEQVSQLAMNPPGAPRDLLYIPARIVMGEITGDVFLPALYPRSHEHPDEGIKLGRKTDYQAEDCGPTLGIGQHTFLVDDEAVGLLEWRRFERATF